MTGWRQYAWIGIWALAYAFSGVTVGSVGFLVAFVVGVAAGAVWQVVARRDVAERLTWVAGLTLATGAAVAVDSLVNSGTSSNLLVGDAVIYLVAVLSSVVITERVLRRRELGPVTLDMVHAPDEVAGAASTDPRRGVAPRPDAGRSRRARPPRRRPRGGAAGTALRAVIGVEPRWRHPMNPGVGTRDCCAGAQQCR